MSSNLAAELKPMVVDGDEAAAQNSLTKNPFQAASEHCIDLAQKLAVSASCHRMM